MDRLRALAALLYDILESATAGAFVGLFIRFAVSMWHMVTERMPP